MHKSTTTAIAGLAVLCSFAHAHPPDGTYTGTLSCGPLLTNPQQGAWSQPVKLHVSGQSVLWERLDARLTEVGSGALRDGRVSFTLEGRWNSGQRNTGQWRNVAMLSWSGSGLSGPATIFSADGAQRLRDCAVQVAMAGGSLDTASTAPRVAKPAAGTPPSAGLPAAAVSALRSAVAAAPVAVQPPISASVASLERSAREREAARDADLVRERAIRENEQRRAQQREAQRREDEQAERQACERRDAQLRSQETWEQQHQREQREYEARRKKEQEEEKQQQLAWQQKEAREAQERAAAQTQYEARAKSAATRHADRIKALGLPSAFVNATLYVSDMGNWQPFLPCAHWLGLLFDNPKIGSVQAISVRGRPGIMIKRTGQPAAGVVFRMEGNEAYLWGTASEGKAEELRTPQEHTLVGMLLKEATLDRGQP